MIRSVQLLSTALTRTPVVIGALRPVILMPVGALVGLPAAQVEALLLHELAHILRHDYLVNIVQSVAEAALFYHPAVWWISHHIRIERELCCDDIAASVSGDVLTYAHALAQLESSRAAEVTAVAATGASLRDRIARLIGEPYATRAVHAPTAVIAIALVLSGGIAFGLFAHAGSFERFTTVSITHNIDGGHGVLLPGEARFLPRGRLVAGWVNLRTLIEKAYQLKPFQVGEGPEWMNSERYNIEAQGEADVTDEQMRLMLRAFLDEKFNLRVHPESQERPVYELRITPDGPTLQAPKPGGCRMRDPNRIIPPPPPPSPTPGQPWITPPAPCNSFTLNVRSPLEARLQAGFVSMTDFANYLERLFDRPIIDNTDVVDVFDVFLSFAPHESIEELRAAISTAMKEQLGIQLEPTKTTTEILVIDHAEEPTVPNW